MRTSYIIYLLLFSVFLTACQQQEYVKINGQTMGTYYTLQFKPESQSVDGLSAQVEQRLEQLNQNLSTYIDDSDLTTLNRSVGRRCFKVSQDTLAVVSEALRIHQLSDGAFDPGLAPLIELWGFDKKQTNNQVPADELIKERQAMINFTDAQVRQEQGCIVKGNDLLQINLSAIAKGYAVDELIAILEQQYGIQNYLVEIGGELRVNGNNAHNKPWTVAIESPDPGSRSVQKVITPIDMAVATSGDYRNFFEKDGKRYSHTINPISGYPIEHKLASITVLHPSTMTADAMATTLMVLGEKAGKDFAQQHNLPVFMIIKSDDGFKEYYNDAFKPYLKSATQ